MFSQQSQNEPKNNRHLFKIWRLLRTTKIRKLFLLCITMSIIMILLQNLKIKQFNALSDEDRHYENLTNRGLKYILLWTREDYAPFYFLGRGQKQFIDSNCTVNNCFVTADKSYFDDINKFHAIAFNGRNIWGLDFYMLSFPKTRSPKQKYIFFNTEASTDNSICKENFDGFFNWTATYKLNSDIPFVYVTIKNLDGEVVGPKLNMNWIKDLKEVEEEFALTLRKKSKAAAWFVSNCWSSSRREDYVKQLQKALEKYKLSVDVYGWCGPLKCPMDRHVECCALLRKDYFFYLALENSIADDYVTEKILTAVNNDVVPIVYGGANYSRFLHPNSYLNAREYSPEDLAEIMHRLITSPNLYKDFFRWKNHYTYHDTSRVENICNLCAALNNKNMTEKHSAYKEFREWWQPNFKEFCKWGFVLAHWWQSLANIQDWFSYVICNMFYK